MDGNAASMVLTWKDRHKLDGVERDAPACLKCGVHAMLDDGTMQPSFAYARYVSKVPQTADDFLAGSETEAETRQPCQGVADQKNTEELLRLLVSY
jgi:hypothetical protein